MVANVLPQTYAEGYTSFLKWSVFPIYTVRNGICTCRKGSKCVNPGKHPKWDKKFIPNGNKNATTDIELIKEWWSRWPDANIGVNTGKDNGFFVLDVDPIHGGDESLYGLIDKYGELPETVEAITGSGGSHYLFKYPDKNIKNDAGNKLGEGLDIRGDGGYIVVEPSIHKSGRRYYWELDHLPSKTPIAPAPEWMIRRITAKEETKRPKIPSNYWYNVMQGVSEGQRNTTTTQVLGHLLRRYVDPDMAWAIIDMWNERNNPSLSEEELQAIFNSIYFKEQKRRKGGGTL